MASTSKVPVNRKETPEVEVIKMYRTKKIQFLGRNTLIVLKNRSEYCPLIAICNILLLRGKLGLREDETEVSEIRLLTLLAETLMTANSNVMFLYFYFAEKKAFLFSLDHWFWFVLQNKDTGSVNNQVQHLSDTLALLPSFATSIDVDIKFKRIDDFEFMRERVIFDMLNIPLYHGCLVDPMDSDVLNAIGSKSFNTVVEELVALERQNMEAMKPTGTGNPFLSDDDSGQDIKYNDDWVTFETVAGGDVCSSLEAVNTSHGPQMNTGGSHQLESGSSAPNVVQESAKGMTVGITAMEGDLIRSFLLKNASQLTPYGLFRLQYDLKEGILCMFIRNNHFNLMFKYGGILYTLVTDEGYINTPGVVWEKLTEVNGGTTFANSSFMSYKKSTNEIEETGSDDDETDKLASIFKNLANPVKTASKGSSSLNPDRQLAKALQKQKNIEQPIKRVADFPSGFIVGPNNDCSSWPTNRNPTSRSLTATPKRPKTNPIHQAGKKLKEKCTLM
ncbi:hypothetical protein QVD17_28389 [Tagetes erecta]|uniref:MINDY deubiquitinase domain-containing protein n=1 Tax=Tagetes erecta TaxID=13708 RepID=A0AAD8KD91_TARER|nr:hypothetical protein QVD17_28389 [Tagetes erecta]